MEDSTLSIQGQKALLIKVKSLWEEIDSISHMILDAEMAMVITSNIQFAKKEIQAVTTVLANSVSNEELNNALGLTVL